MSETSDPLAVPAPEKGDRLFKPLNRPQGGTMVHPGGVIDAEENRDITIRRYLYEEGYKRAADLLVGALQGGPQRDELLYPVAFLYRQYLELKLKSLLKSIPWEPGSEASLKPKLDEHRLMPLWTTVRDSVLPAVWPEANLKKVEAVESCIAEFDGQDPGSIAFRYSEEKYEKDKNSKQTLQNLESVDISNLKDVMARLANFLDCIDEAIGRFIEYRSDLVDNVDY